MYKRIDDEEVGVVRLGKDKANCYRYSLFVSQYISKRTNLLCLECSHFPIFRTYSCAFDIDFENSKNVLEIHWDHKNVSIPHHRQWCNICQSGTKLFWR